VVQLPLPGEAARGTFFAPAVIELPSIAALAELTREVFGPVLHVVRWHRDELPALIDGINASGYGLTHGIQTRIDETAAAILSRVRAGNVYINRNIVGAVVGVQPFGGHGLSGTGPKAGGPLYVRRLTRGGARAALPEAQSLPGPTGEANTLEFHPRGVVACIADDAESLLAQTRAARAAGNTPLWLRSPLTLAARDRLAGERVTFADALDPAAVDAVLLDTTRTRARRVHADLAAAEGRIIPVIAPDADGGYDPASLVVERTVTVNTAAAGGNAALLSLSEDRA
jgi:RHH-type proline utilization regulon transcriptional repressor/proline dehydrogenase/delta 1-pyrroline-5-carboxylate dehydrogenase